MDISQKLLLPPPPELDISSTDVASSVRGVVFPVLTF